jgi:hypothetical protein
MSGFPCLVRFVSGSGQVRYRLGDRLADRYLELLAGRCRPNTLRAVAFDLKAFFEVTGKNPAGSNPVMNAICAPPPMLPPPLPVTTRDRAPCPAMSVAPASAGHLWPRTRTSAGRGTY